MAIAQVENGLLSPADTFLMLQRCARPFGFISSPCLSARALHRSTRLHAYGVNPNNKKGDEYGPQWPPMPSSQALEEAASGEWCCIPRTFPPKI